VFFFVWRILSFHCHSPSYSGFSQIFHIPLSFHCHSPYSPHSVSPNFPSSFGFPSFPLIPLSFHCHLVSPRSPVIPLIRFLKFPCHSPHSPGFPLIRFPLLYTQFSLGCSLMVVLSRLSFSSPVLSWFSLAIPLFSEEAGQHHRFKGQEGRRARPQGSAPHPQFLSLSPPAVSPPVYISLFILDPVTGKQGRDWLGKLPNVQEKLCFFMACLWWIWLGFSVSLFECDEEMKKKTRYGKKIDRQLPQPWWIVCIENTNTEK